MGILTRIADLNPPAENARRRCLALCVPARYPVSKPTLQLKKRGAKYADRSGDADAGSDCVSRYQPRVARNAQASASAPSDGRLHGDVQRSQGQMEDRMGPGHFQCGLTGV